jgi:hypothetical protein
MGEAHPSFNLILGLSRDLQDKILDHVNLFEIFLLLYRSFISHMLVIDLSFGITYITNESTPPADRAQV